MSDVEKFYEAMRKHFPNAPEFSHLNPMEVHQMVQGINLILQIVDR